MVAGHETTPAGWGRNVRPYRAKQGKARRRGTFFPDRVVCFPRGDDTPAPAKGQRNQREAQSVGSLAEAMAAPGLRLSRRPRNLGFSGHGDVLSGPHHAAPARQSRAARERFTPTSGDMPPANRHWRDRNGPTAGRWMPCAECLRPMPPVLIYAPSRPARLCRSPGGISFEQGLSSERLIRVLRACLAERLEKWQK